MDKDPHHPPKPAPNQPGTPLHGVSIAILAAMTIVGTYLFASDTQSMILVAPVVAAGLVGANMLGIRSSRRR